MAAKDKKKSKRVKPPKGFAQIPDWWMEITPHDTLYPDEDEVQRQTATQEAKMYKDLAAQADWQEANASKYELGPNGELIDKKTGNPIEIGGAFTKGEGGWMKDGKEMFGGDLKKVSASGPAYGHKDMNWKKPEWMGVSSFSQQLKIKYWLFWKFTFRRGGMAQQIEFLSSVICFMNELTFSILRFLDDIEDQ